MVKAFSIKVTGDVQGVSYRYFAKNEARRLDLVGWTRNEHDGSVNVVIQGETDLVDEFISWAKVGSPMATVDEVAVTPVPVDEKMIRFEVR